MDMLLAEYMLNDPSKIDKTFISKLLSSGIKKAEVCSFVVQVFVLHMLSDNVWVLQKLIDYLNAIENCKPTDTERLILTLVDLFRLLEQCPKKTYKFRSENDTIQNKHLFQEDINSILYQGRERESTTLLPLKGVLHEETYALINVLDDILTFPIDIETATQKSFFIIRYLLILPPRKYLQHGEKSTMDIPDFLFWLCISFTRKSECSEPLRSYVSLAKDIFYYRLKKKDKLARIGILFYTFHVIIKRRVREQEIDYVSELEQLVNEIDKKSDHSSDVELESRNSSKATCDVSTKKKSSNRKTKDIDYHRSQTQTQQACEKTKAKCQFLFFYSHYDEQKQNIIKAEKQRKEMMTKLMRASIKEIEIDSLLLRDGRDDVRITKLNR